MNDIIGIYKKQSFSSCVGGGEWGVCTACDVSVEWCCLSSPFSWLCAPWHQTREHLLVWPRLSLGQTGRLWPGASTGDRGPCCVVQLPFLCTWGGGRQDSQRCKGSGGHLDVRGAQFGYLGFGDPHILPADELLPLGGEHLWWPFLLQVQRLVQPNPTERGGTRHWGWTWCARTVWLFKLICSHIAEKAAEPAAPASPRVWWDPVLPRGTLVTEDRERRDEERAGGTSGGQEDAWERRGGRGKRDIGTEGEIKQCYKNMHFICKILYSVYFLEYIFFISIKYFYYKTGEIWTLGQWTQKVYICNYIKILHIIILELF